MASRQPPSVEVSQAELEEEEGISGNGEGDEIMEEPEEQEDGYSACSCLSIRANIHVLVFYCPPGGSRMRTDS